MFPLFTPLTLYSIIISSHLLFKTTHKFLALSGVLVLFLDLFEGSSAIVLINTHSGCKIYKCRFFGYVSCPTLYVLSPMKTIPLSLLSLQYVHHPRMQLWMKESMASHDHFIISTLVMCIVKF